MREEHWKPVKGYEGLYSVSDMGRVMSHYHGKDRILKGVMTPGGRSGVVRGRDGSRLAVSLHRAGRQATKFIHTLVLETFAPDRQPGEEARHGEGGAYDNRYPESLSWGTHEENMGADKDRDGTYNRGPKLAESDVREILTMHSTGTWSRSSLAEKFDVTDAAIGHVLKGRRHRRIWLEFNA